MSGHLPADNIAHNVATMGAKDDTKKCDAAKTSAKTITTTLMNIASIVEKADEQVRYAHLRQQRNHIMAQVLPAVYLFIGASLRVSLQQLGQLTAARAVVQVRTNITHCTSRYRYHHLGTLLPNQRRPW